ncbi:alpha/beta fold hydrolase [Amycolatopsis regifaucium]|uniref:Alpha/beta hydrolase n=1 Tax=Amycolatopsis regifaucium TaxID=546365 RepID=A0A154MPM9_9PSEU|nr:alpha/beta hydrolase [Amycolatopsis regifaucium]KZB86050.1 alpha/beta hydrolase [Amycolatopsis regifaucium]OKA04942.1 alpha/beta hydrolase [Amycolatopsis regifaucium]SFH76020.1 Pimeloyl-ACP methyl ester carboxylesterase [Amycolatopsis regifaucium]
MTKIGGFRNPAVEKRYYAAYDRAIAECPEPDAVLDVETPHGTTRVYRYGGDGPPIALLPGLMATSACYAALIPSLAERHRIYAIDTLGEAGRSVQVRPFKDIRDRAIALDDVFASLGLTSVHLVGGSTGGWHAVNQAIHAPGRLASLGLLDATTVSAPFTRKVFWYGAVAAILDNDRLWRGFLKWSAGADVLDQPAAQLVLAGIRSYRARVPFQTCPAEEALRSVKLPVFALFGARSVVHDSIVAAGRLKDLVPHADVEVLPDAGHYLYLRPEDRALIVERILRSAPE